MYKTELVKPVLLEEFTVVIPTKNGRDLSSFVKMLTLVIGTFSVIAVAILFSGSPNKSASIILGLLGVVGMVKLLALKKPLKSGNTFIFIQTVASDKGYDLKYSSQLPLPDVIGDSTDTGFFFKTDLSSLTLDQDGMTVHPIVVTKLGEYEYKFSVYEDEHSLILKTIIPVEVTEQLMTLRNLIKTVWDTAVDDGFDALTADDKYDWAYKGQSIVYEAYAEGLNVDKTSALKVLETLIEGVMTETPVDVTGQVKIIP